jgi:hypothetical protein
MRHHDPTTMRRSRSSGVVKLALVSLTLALWACVPEPAFRQSQSAATADGSFPSPSGSVPTGPSPTPSFFRPTPTPGPSFATYKVKRGDTLARIAKQFKTTAASISYWNRVTYPSLDPESTKYRPDRLEVGWELVLVPNAQVDPEALPTLTPKPTTTPAPTPSPSA